MKTPDIGTKPERTVYLDYLRVVASLAVMLLHVAGQNWHSADVYGLEWQTLNLYDSAVRWGVPIFVMISGALFLNRDIPTGKLYTKYIFRMACAFLFWGVVYALFFDGDLLHKIYAALLGHGHMWFIPMVIGLYMCQPLLRPIARSESLVRYFLLLSFVFAFVTPSVSALAEDFGGGVLLPVVTLLNTHAAAMNMHTVLGYTAYFMLGFFLSRYELSKKQRLLVTFLGILGFVLTAGISAASARLAHAPTLTYYNEFSVNVLLESAAVFVWFKYGVRHSERLNRFFARLSKISFGAYLVHLLVLEQLAARLGIHSLSFPPVLSVPAIAALVFVLSYAVSALLSRIPKVGRFIT